MLSVIRIVHLSQQLAAVLKQKQNISGTAEATLESIIQRLTNNSGNINTDALTVTTNSLGSELSKLAIISKNLPENLNRLVSCAVSLADSLPWYQRDAANNPCFMNGHINAQIMGPEGIEVRHDLIVGVTIMRPNVVYPDHQHEPEEIYIVLSNGRWRQGNGDWYTPGLGTI